MWWILGFRAAAAEVTPGSSEVTPGSSRGVVAEVVEGRGLLERGEMGLDADIVGDGGAAGVDIVGGGVGVGQLDRLDNEG